MAKKGIISALVTFIFCLACASAFAANSVPQVGTISLTAGSSVANTPVTFTTTYSDPNGWQDLVYVDLLINSVVDGRNCLFAMYKRSENKLYLRNDAATS